MMSRATFLYLSWVLLAVFAAVQADGRKTLVLVDDIAIRQSHSLFFAALEAQGHDLTFTTPGDVDVTFRSYGEFLFENLIVFAPSAEDFSSSLDATSILEFLDQGGDLLMAVDSTISAPIRELAKECGVAFDAPGTSVIDHFHYDESDADGDHTLIVATELIKAHTMVGKNPPKTVLFNGIGQKITEESVLSVAVLSASSTAYSHSPDEPVKAMPHVVGQKTVLVSALQARNNARAVFAGSLEMFSNSYFHKMAQVHGSKAKPEEAGNAVFCVELTKWVFKDRGVLKAENVHYTKKGETEKPKFVRVMDDIEYSVQLSELVDGQWMPYVSDEVALEWRMLDPYLRTFLEHDGKGYFHTAFVVPDVYGVFKFSLSHVRLGYTFLSEIDQLPARPFRHNEYERFISSAFPYYAATFSMMAGFLLFAAVFLYHKSS